MVSKLSQVESRIQNALRNGATSLILSNSDLREFPQSLRYFTRLQRLNLSNNYLTTLPEWIAELKNLEELILFGNSLAQLPDALGQCPRLRCLSLSNNHLTTLPVSLAASTELQELYLAANAFSEFPESLTGLPKLRVLTLGHNDIETLPESIGRLRTLECLDLTSEGNIIAHWSPQSWTVYNGLDRRSKLRALPESLGQLNIKQLYLHGNPKLKLPREVLGASWYDVIRGRQKPENPQKILDYYFRLRGGKRPLNEGKLILLGRGEVGKTCLVNRLVYDKFARTSMTCGIAITHWLVPIGKETVRLHVWDFGGQEIQHATHQFFLTERSLYVVVLNGRAGDEENDAEYWLKFVKTFGASSPTIVVLNKIKVQPFQMNRKALQDKYPFIRGFIETDCKPQTNNGRQQMIKEIKSAISSMPNVRADFPAGWFQIKERLSKMRKPFISFKEYRKICAELGELDPTAQERLAGFLDDLGVALNFREDQQLRDETVLNPHWITEGVYQIITSKVLAERQGELSSKDLKIIFKGKKSYPPRMHLFLLELMRKFELCFPYHEDPQKHRYLVPELLGKEEPTIKEPFRPAKCLNFRYDYRLMPEGLMSRFITRTHTMSKPAERWRTGVVLRWESCRAQVKADKQERQVLVRVMGQSEKRRRLLAVIRENFDQIHSEMREFKPTEWVALEGHPDEWISFRELENLQKSKVSELPKSVGDEVMSVNVTELLNETDVPGAREREPQAGAVRPLKLFISYAHEDEAWRAKLAPNLGLLEREGLIELWCDLQITPGAKWDEEIKRRLNEADLYLFLMSTNLLISEYVQKTELPIARARHKENKARLIPVVVRQCGWARYVGDIQGLPKAGRPVKQWSDKDQAFFDVEEGLRRAIAEVRRLVAR
jgi:internalin A